MEFACRYIVSPTVVNGYALSDIILRSYSDFQMCDVSDVNLASKIYFIWQKHVSMSIFFTDKWYSLSVICDLKPARIDVEMPKNVKLFV
jgi:hypothetical protein